MKKLISTTIFSMALVVGTHSALAENLNVNFEPSTYTIGNINTQDGWSKTGPYDANVVSNTYGYVTFGTQALRVSNSITSGSFGDQTFSKSLTNEAGETSAQNGGMSGGTRENHFEAEFDLATVMTSLQPGLSISVSPDRGDGARMSYLRFVDNTTGVDVYFDDYQDMAPFGTAVGDAANGCGVGDDFNESLVGTLSRTSPHKIKFVMDFVDGSRNDVVKIYLDNILVKTGTSWEDYFRYCEGNETRTVDSLLFRVGGTAAPTTDGNGYLVDNLNLMSGIPMLTPTTKDECKNNGWMSFNAPTFKNQGDCVSFIQSNPKAVGNKSK